MKKNSYGIEHLSSEILSVLNQTLLKDIYDDVIKLASFTDVKLSSDRTCLIVYIDTFDHSNIDFVIKKLNNAKGVFKTALAKNISIHKVPNIIFKKDTAIENSMKIDNILREIHTKEKK